MRLYREELKIMDLAGTDLTKAQSIDVNDCLARILSSPIFVQAERQQRFLRYVVAETLAGHADRLKGYTIGVEVFDREQSFDPTIDAIVRVEAARLRAKLREYYDGEGRNDPVRLELPKGKYAIHMEWRGEAPPQAASPAASTRPQAIMDKPSLAILPFTNMSSDPEQEYFADGFTDCLITEISRLSGLFVISRHSSFIYKKTAKRAEEIGLELGVRYLLEGSVQRSGEWVRITAQLIDAASGAHVWADHYDRQLKDIFAIQDDVTRCIAAILQVKLTPAAAEGHNYGGTGSLEAHDALLRGLECLWTYGQEPVEQAQKHFEHAVALDPRYAVAHAWLARALTMRWIFLWDARDEVLERALQHVRTALDIDPQLPLAHAVLCWVQRWRLQKDAAIEAGRRAVLLDPNSADAHLFLSLALSAANLGQEGLQCIEKGMRLNPHPSSLYLTALGLSYLVMEDYDLASQAFQRGIALNDAFLPNHYFLCIVYMLQHRDDEARRERDKALSLAGGKKPVVQTGWLDDELNQRFRRLTQLAGLV